MKFNDEYHLYDLRVEVVSAGDGRPMVCRHNEGDFFSVTDDDLLTFPAGVSFPMYPLAALIPILSAKTRELDPNDWMFTDTDIACPDPNCGGLFHISRGERRTYRNSEQTTPRENANRKVG
ncbi:TIGR04076 family protein [Williamsia phyllosphaerae]|uniref:TIGR04076 family protein n=1 Tax=Williamsia phyllosphaerae TaxID=885042 RepID=A0ABQ1U8F4_9NOCA|nr:TIGR04076 family protein [Williamsia phyllosphaerae]GGF11617.1 TIGR04076 family protein [Williamsia phyllosphaerae]